MLRSSPLKQHLIAFFLLSFLVGVVADYYLGTEIDYWVHDEAVTYQKRTAWPHMGVVVLDDGVPINVGRKQALPLYARASERLIAAGAKGLFLDARLFKGMEGRMPFALCIKEGGGVKWSDPQCSFSTAGQCNVVPSAAGNAPLRMNEQAIQRFSIAPYLNPHEQDFLLFDWDTVMLMPAEGINASDRLITKDSPIARWFDLSDDHAIRRLANYIDATAVEDSLANTDNNELCNEGRVCRRIRLSEPAYRLQVTGERLILPLSVLASCNEDIAMQMAKKLANKAVVLQVTGPKESTDTLVSTMTTAFLSPKLMTPGPQYIVDEVETFLNQDHPRMPLLEVKYGLFAVEALFTILAGAYLIQPILWLGGVLIFTLLIALCFLNPLIQLWPVTVSLLVFLTGAGLTTSEHLLLGFRRGKFMSNYIPKQIETLLMSLHGSDSFMNHRCQAVVLMSDLAGYTAVTGLLKDPNHVMDLMNDYLHETSIVLKGKYEGWLEAYVGDLVCYYWPYSDDSIAEQDKNELGKALDKQILTQDDAFHHILSGALELAMLQHKFFSTLSERYKGKIDDDILDKIAGIINAGVGITSGTVVMGSLGPQMEGIGLKRFGILGDPLNLASRIEGLSRFFNTEVIITEELLPTAEQSGFKYRRLGVMSVKGRKEPATIYALGYADDARFSDENIQAWELWLKNIELKASNILECPDVFAHDKASILGWLERDLLGEHGVWYLDQK